MGDRVTTDTTERGLETLICNELNDELLGITVGALDVYC